MDRTWFHMLNIIMRETPAVRRYEGWSYKHECLHADALGRMKTMAKAPR
jgi:hypothetical protein